MGIRRFAPRAGVSARPLSAFAPRPFAPVRPPARPRPAMPAAGPALAAPRGAVQPLRIKRVDKLGKDSYELAAEDDARDVIDTHQLFSQ